MPIIGTLPATLTNGTIADAPTVQSIFDYIRNQVNANGAAAGANTDITALLGLTTPLGRASGGTSTYISTAASTGTANAQVVATLSPNSFSLVEGNRVLFEAGATNTSATTFNINGTGVKNVFKQTTAGVVALTGGEIVIGDLVDATYDGTQYVLMDDKTAAYGPITTLASATTTDLGTIPSRNVSITGTTTITGLGSTALTSRPIYFVRFTGILTLTYNATSLILPGSANITTAAGDSAIFEYLGSGNWQCREYMRADGTPVISAAYATDKRQTVISGPYNSNGTASFLTTSANLNLTSQNISSTYPLVVGSAYGSGVGGALNRFGQTTSNLTWTGLTNAATNYLFVTVNADGTLTPGFTTTAPVYQWGGTPSVTSGQYTFVIAEMKMYLGNGATAAQVYVVFVGEAVTAGSAVTTVTAYAYRGLYQYDDTSSLPGSATAVSKNANIGVTTGVTATVGAVCSSAEFGFAVGEFVDLIGASNGTTVLMTSPRLARNTVAFTTGFSTSWLVTNATTGAQAALTAASWRYRIIVRRVW